MNRSTSLLPARRWLPLLGLLGLGAVVAGCSSDETCELGLCGSGGAGDGGASATTGTSTQSGNPTSTGGGEGGGSGNTSTSTSTGTGGEGGSSSTGVVQNCVPEDLAEGEEIGADCIGWFVDPSADAGGADGSREAPYASLEQALLVAESGQRIYVCGTPNGPQTEGSLTIEKSVAIHGGWGCVSWSKFDGESRWTAAAGEIPLRVIGDDVDVLVQGFAIEAASAEEPGGSSIAVLVDGATVEFADSSVVAGDGANGASGEELVAVPTPDSMNGINGNAGCISTAAVDGGDPGTNSCGVMTDGGAGGQGRTGNGLSGGGGLPDEVGGAFGAGQTSTTPCGNGLPGTPGTDGSPGEGAVGLGQLSSQGFTPASGAAGVSDGMYGGGGGGGGGARICANSNAGPSGGGGGAGGCGGLRGAGGSGGGGSFGIVAIGGAVTLRATEVSAANGGAGGDGARGQPGQLGGTAGLNVGANACDGAPGGDGGQGGSGGGGRGGHSVAVALSDEASLNADGTSDLQFGDAGLGGQGGIGDDVANTGGAGADGIAAEQQEF